MIGASYPKRGEWGRTRYVVSSPGPVDCLIFLVVYYEFCSLCFLFSLPVFPAQIGVGNQQKMTSN